MVSARNRLAGLVAAGLCGVLGSACPVQGTTCGRGRCEVGACVQVASTFGDKGKVELDWWCAKPCRSSARCPTSTCLQSPLASELELCAGNQVQVQYLYDGAPVTDAGARMATYRLLSGKFDGGGLDCVVNQVCKAGWFSSGEYLPKIVGTTPAGSVDLTILNGTAGAAWPATSSSDGGRFAPLGPLLPMGLPLTVHIQNEMDPLF